jgi:hypothetical protein
MACSLGLKLASYQQSFAAKVGQFGLEQQRCFLLQSCTDSLAATAVRQGSSSGPHPRIADLSDSTPHLLIRAGIVQQRWDNCLVGWTIDEGYHVAEPVPGLQHRWIVISTVVHLTCSNTACDSRLAHGVGVVSLRLLEDL